MLGFCQWGWALDQLESGKSLSWTLSFPEASLWGWPCQCYPHGYNGAQLKFLELARLLRGCHSLKVANSPACTRWDQVPLEGAQVRNSPQSGEQWPSPHVLKEAGVASHYRVT